MNLQRIINGGEARAIDSASLNPRPPPRWNPSHGSRSLPLRAGRRSGPCTPGARAEDWAQGGLLHPWRTRPTRGRDAGRIPPETETTLTQHDTELQCLPELGRPTPLWTLPPGPFPVPDSRPPGFRATEEWPVLGCRVAWMRRGWVCEGTPAPLVQRCHGPPKPGANQGWERKVSPTRRLGHPCVTSPLVGLA